MLLKRYFPDLSAQQSEMFSMLEALYSEWNSRINVISRRDISFFYERHVLHSLAISKVITFAKDAKALDVGTGGGFPGIPLAILFPETNFHLIDSIGKKLKVVDNVIKELQLQNVTTQHIRAEQLSEKYDFVVSRAVASLSDFMPWMKGKFLNRNLHTLPNGLFLLKGGNIDDEIQPFRKNATVFNVRDFFSEPFFEEKKILYIKYNV